MEKKINLWSGPRNVSTALMYAFAQRSDMQVVDEPLYAHYLRLTGVEHPGRDEILAKMENAGENVLATLMQPDAQGRHRFIKQMAHHWLSLPASYLAATQHIFLIRSPDQVIYSYQKVIPHPVLADIGIRKQYHMFQQIAKQGPTPAVLDGNELLKSPEKVLRKLCEDYLGIDFEPAMLTWQAGAIPEDGCWAKYWYHNVHQSTGFQPYTPKEVILNEAQTVLYQQAKPFYEALSEHAITA